jgi:peptidoglycan/LPS O-acetylase OafA/YrhL
MLVNRLRRVTRDGRWIPEIDGLRFVAISSVVLFRVYQTLQISSGRFIPVEPSYWWLERLMYNGHRGVWVFFVLSGMILALPFARNLLEGSRPVSLRKYYMRRVTRLEPPYIASILFASLIAVVHWHGFAPGFALHVLASAFYQHNVVYGAWSSVNGVLWSLEVEIQFYVLAPLAMQWYRIRKATLRRTLMFTSILFYLGGTNTVSDVAESRAEYSVLFSVLPYRASGSRYLCARC